MPLDGSEAAERALGPGLALADAFGAKPVVVTSRWSDGPKAALEYLDRIERRVERADLDTVLVHDREPAPAIQLVAGDHPDPAIVMTTHGRGGLGVALLGSVAEEVVRTVRAPVVLVGPHARWPQALDQMVVTVDGSHTGAAILPVAAIWARALGARVVLVEVVDESDARAAEARDDAPLLVTRPLEAEAKLLADEGVPVTYEALRGDPRLIVVEFASQLPAGMIAMATHGRMGLRRVTLGSVAMAVVHHAQCPVLVVRPGELRD